MRAPPTFNVRNNDLFLACMMATQSSATECPVCERMIPLKDMNVHIDGCLATSEARTKSEASPDLPGQRKQSQSLLNFSPSSSCSSQPPLKKRKVESDVAKMWVGWFKLFSSILLCRNAGSSDHAGSCNEPPAPSLTSPLADAVRPSALEDFVGQDTLTGKHSFLHSIIQTGEVPSLIFWGPPGCGKVNLRYY